jgi:hypothetical protein
MSAAAERGRLSDLLRGRLERPEAALVAVLLAGAVALAWFGEGLLVAIGVALGLALGGFGSVTVLGPARAGLGLARYLTVPLAAIAMALGGRLLPGGLALLLLPLTAVLVWSLLWLELHFRQRGVSQWALVVALVIIHFAAASGLIGLFGRDAWPPPLILIGIIAFLLGLRLAEGRGEGGLRAVGHAVLHALVVAQVGAAVLLLELAGAIGPALMSLAFYVWSGAVEALERGSSTRSVAVEFGALTVLGLVWALLLHQG